MLRPGEFFMRLVFQPLPSSDVAPEDLQRRLHCQWRSASTCNGLCADRDAHRRVLLMVSKFDHCLADILYRWRIGELADGRSSASSPITRATPTVTSTWTASRSTTCRSIATDKAAQEAQVWRVIEQSGAELVVLARYMQVLSDDLAGKLAGRCINIHHSFLPGFKGARPYHQAHRRGVKLIGATAHFVTAELDEGPIIEQDIERVSHQRHAEDMIRIGRDIERRVLARTLRLVLDDRVLIDGHKTVVFAPLATTCVGAAFQTDEGIAHRVRS